MTLRFIVARILRELIELAERDDDAELVAALHDALDVASPAGRLSRGAPATGYLDSRVAELLRTAGGRRSPAAGVAAASAPNAGSAGPGSRIRGDQVCARQPAGAACWMEIAQRPGCYQRRPSG